MSSTPKTWSKFEYDRLEKLIQRLKTYQARLKDISDGATISDKDKIAFRSRINKMIAAIVSAEEER